MNWFLLSFLVLSVLLGDCYSEPCKKGDMKHEDCNNCFCLLREWICTDWDCHPRKERGVPVAADLKNTPCAPNDYFKIDCNTCYCNIDKTGYLCTENLCTFTDSPATEAPSNETSPLTNLFQNETTNVNETIALAPTNFTESDSNNNNHSVPLVATNNNITESISNNNNNSVPLVATNNNFTESVGNGSDTGGGTSNSLNL